MNSRPVMAWRNVLEYEPDLVVTHSSDEQGYPFPNALDWRDYTRWKSSDSGELFVKIDADALTGHVITLDCLAIAGHDLATAGVTGLSLEYSDDDQDYSPCFDPIDPEDAGVIFRRFSAQTHRFFKLVIPSGYTAAPEIGVLFMGEAMEIPAFPDAGFDPDAMTAETAAEYGRTGRLLGIGAKWLRREIKVGFSRLPASFVSDEWVPFWKQHGVRPFFFAWDPETRPEQAYLVRLDSPKLEAPYDKALRSLSLTLTGAAAG